MDSYIRATIPEDKKIEFAQLASSKGLSTAAYLRSLIYAELEKTKTEK